MASTEGSCDICKKAQHKYKCPSCTCRYCSVVCFKNHKNAEMCKKPLVPDLRFAVNTTSLDPSCPSEDTIDFKRLQRLNTLQKSGVLADPHLRQLLLKLDSAERREPLLDALMREPIFVEFANDCFSILDSDDDE